MAATPYIPNADSTRSAHFRAGMRGRGTFWTLFGGASIGFLAGAYLRDPLVMAAAPSGWAMLITAFQFFAADKHAQMDFFGAISRSLGLVYLGAGDLPPLTPLLGAGDRRRYEHVMCTSVHGGLGQSDHMLAHYTFETADRDRSSDALEKRGWNAQRFTVFVTDFEPGITYFRGIYLRRRKGLFGPFDHDWLRGRDLTKIELESTAFDQAYDLLAVTDQDRLAVRQLFSPTLVDWLARHPLQPSIEYRAGTLVVYLPGHVEDGGKLTWFYESSRELAQRLVAEVREAA